MYSYYVEFILTDNDPYETGTVTIDGFKLYGTMSGYSLKSGFILPKSGMMCTFSHEKDGITYNASVPITENFSLVTITLATGYGKVGKPSVLVRKPGEYDADDVIQRLKALEALTESIKNGTYVDEDAIERRISGLEKAIEEKLYAAIGCLILPLLWPVSIYFFVERNKMKKELESLRQQLK